MKRSDFRFLERLRVRWAEVDMQKIVFNAHYLMYFDTAVAGYWRALAMPYHETMAALGGDLYVRKATLEYLGSARYDDVCEVGVRSGRIGNSSILIDCAVFRGETPLVHGELVYVFADPATQTSQAVPPDLRHVLQAFEAGESMLSVRTGGWAELGEEARRIRKAVFVDELLIPAELAWDDADADAVHVLVSNRLGAALATGRGVRQDSQTFRISRLAVVAGLRGSAIGSALLKALVLAAAQHGAKRVLLQAQAGAVGFYLRRGFSAVGTPFEEHGILHQALEMVV